MTPDLYMEYCGVGLNGQIFVVLYKQNKLFILSHCYCIDIILLCETGLFHIVVTNR